MVRLVNVREELKHTPWFCHGHENCDIDGRPSDIWRRRSWEWGEKRIAKIWFVPQDVDMADPGANWNYLLKSIEQLRGGLERLGFIVEVFDDGSREGLAAMLRGRADYRFLGAHGDKAGVTAVDGGVEWNEILEMIGPTGLIHVDSCSSFDANAVDDDGPFPFWNWLVCAESETDHARAAILMHKESHAFPGRSSLTDESFEVSKLLRILEYSLKDGFRNSIERHRREMGEMMGQDAGAFVDHMVAVGDPDWGISG